MKENKRRSRDIRSHKRSPSTTIIARRDVRASDRGGMRRPEAFCLVRAREPRDDSFGLSTADHHLSIWRRGGEGRGGEGVGPPVWGARTSSTALLAAWGARRLGSVLGAPLSLSLFHFSASSLLLLPLQSSIVVRSSGLRMRTWPRFSVFHSFQTNRVHRSRYMKYVSLVVVSSPYSSRPALSPFSSRSGCVCSWVSLDFSPGALWAARICGDLFPRACVCTYAFGAGGVCPCRVDRASWMRGGKGKGTIAMRW